MMNLVFCKHEGNNKQYLFEVSMSVSLDTGDRVFVNTIYGQKEAICTTENFYVEDEAAKAIIKGCSGYFPLAQVIGRSVTVQECQPFEALIF